MVVVIGWLGRALATLVGVVLIVPRLFVLALALVMAPALVPFHLQCATVRLAGQVHLVQFRFPNRLVHPTALTETAFVMEKEIACVIAAGLVMTAPSLILVIHRLTIEL